MKIKLSIKILFIFHILNSQYTAIDTASLQNSPDIAVQEVCQNVCDSPSCDDAAQNLLKNMNLDVHPCENFYQFACGNFIKNEIIPDGVDRISTSKYASYHIINEIYRELMEEIKETDLGLVKKVKAYFQNCFNESRIEMESPNKLFQLLENIGGWPVLLGNNWNETQFDWHDKIYSMMDVNFILAFPVTLDFIIADEENSTKSILTVNNAFTKIDETYLVNAPDNKYLMAYYNLIVDTAVELGAHAEAAQEEMIELLNFEIELFKISTSMKTLLNIPTVPIQITVDDLSKKHPSIPWYQMFNKVLKPSGISIGSHEIVIVEDMEFIADLEELIKITPKRVIANYLTWRVVHDILPSLSDRFQKIHDRFAIIVGETPVVQPRAYKCFNEVDELLSVALNVMYVKNNFDQQMENDISSIFQNIKNKMMEHFKTVQWMDHKTREAAIEKLKEMKLFTGYIDEFMNFEKADQYYNDLHIYPGTYFESMLNLTNFIHKKRFYYARHTVDYDDWGIHSYNVQAEYSPQENSLILPAGQLQRPYYQPDSPRYLNYAGIGTIIGHEITHGFDNERRLYDKNGNHINWQADAQKVFLQKVQCLIDQYNNFTVAEIGININGSRTVNENIADIGGFTSAYHAYNEWTRVNNESEPCLPNLTYTPRQLFWIKAANNWCSKWKPEFLKNRILTGTHSSEEARILIPFANLKEFAQDFSCEIGSKMNPKDKCSFT